MGEQLSPLTINNKFDTFYHGFVFGGITVSIASVYLLCKHRLLTDNVSMTQKHKQDVSNANLYIIKLKNYIHKLKKYNKMLEINLGEISLVNRDLNSKILEKNTIDIDTIDIDNTIDIDTIDIDNNDQNILVNVKKPCKLDLNIIESQPIDTIIMLANTN
jgi:hypothetical protein